MSTRINLWAANHGSSHEPGGSDVVELNSHHPGTIVFTAAAGSTSWRDVDLTAVTGAINCMVALKILAVSAANSVYVRPNNDTDDYHITPSQGCGCAVLHVPAAGKAGILVLPAVAGMIEHYADLNNTYSIEVVSWW